MENIKKETLSHIEPLPVGVKTKRNVPALTTHEAETRFLVPEKKEFHTQYFNIYRERVNQIRTSFISGIHELLVKEGLVDVPVCGRIIDLQQDACGVVIGALYKDMPKKPSALDLYDNDNASSFQDHFYVNYCCEEDALVLEDEFGKVQLVFNGPVQVNNSNELVDVASLCTGCVCGVFGEFNALGELEVQRVFFPSACHETESNDLIKDDNSSSNADEYIVCISDLGIGGDKYDPLALELLCEYIEGALDTDNPMKSITQVIVCGNTFDNSALIPARHALQVQAQDPAIQELLQARNLSSVTEADMLFTRIASSVNLVVTPGMQDPSNYIIPQQPLHQLLVPSASTYCSFKSTTNPAYITTHNSSILVTDGHNVTDIVRFTNLTPMKAQLLTLNSRIVTPTAPDTYNCYPYANVDPFFIDQLPRLYLVGTQPEFDVKLVKVQDTLRMNEYEHNTLCVNVPSFTKTKLAVLINTKTLSAQTIAFSSV